MVCSTNCANGAVQFSAQFTGWWGGGGVVVSRLCTQIGTTPNCVKMCVVAKCSPLLTYICRTIYAAPARACGSTAKKHIDESRAHQRNAPRERRCHLVRIIGWPVFVCVFLILGEIKRTKLGVMTSTYIVAVSLQFSAFIYVLPISCIKRA